MEPTTLLDEVRGFLSGLRTEWPDLFAPRPRRPAPPRPAPAPEPAPVLPPPPPDAAALAHFHARAAHWAPRLGVTFGRIRVKGQRTLWGSCTPAGDLNFNWRLTLAPPEVLDYVVIHELAHRLEMNHSRRFWAHVEKHCPDHRVHRRWLRKNGEALYRVARASAVVLLLALAGAARAAGWQAVGPVTRVDVIDNGMELTAGQAKVRVTRAAEGVLRVRLAPHGGFPKDRSWAVVEKAAPAPVRVEDGPDAATLRVDGLAAVVHKSPFAIDFADAGGVILADDPAFPMSWDGERVRAWKAMPEDESYFGLGDKAGPMDRRGRAFSLWNTDAYGWQESTDPLYKSIPFFVGLRRGAAYGLFFDDAYRSDFDFGVAQRGDLSFGAEGGDLDYYFIAGPAPKKVLERFTALTGRAPLPPLWSLGYQQCRYSYYPEARVRQVAKTFRDKGIPADAIYLDIDYQDGYRPFTVNRTFFPTFEKMIRDLRGEGFHTIAITDLHIGTGTPGGRYAPFEDGVKKDVFVRNADGSLYLGPVWPGDSAFPDFTLTRVRDWWGGLYKDFVADGIAGFWNDMNEPAVFRYPAKTMPLDVEHRLDDGTVLDHRAVHNVLGMENARATYDGLLRLRPGERPFVLTRAAYAGAWRYAASWTGDNSSTWNHLALSTPQLLSLGLSGYGLVGDDIGGFAGSPSADLLTRWMELGAFNPVFRGHAAKGTRDREPWVDGPEHEALRRRAIERRYELLPYLYTHVEEMTRTGVPLMRPLFLEYPEAQDRAGESRDFLFGPDLFVAPAFNEMPVAQDVRLPPGAWYEYGTSVVHSSTETLSLRPALGELPVFVRAGAILPRQPVVQTTDETPAGPLLLDVYPGENCSGELYADDGHTFAYKKGKFLRERFSCEAKDGVLKVTGAFEKSGYTPWWRSARLTVYRVPEKPKEIRVAGKPVFDWTYDSGSKTVVLTVDDARRDWAVELR